jgi:hypothetical protein
MPLRDEVTADVRRRLRRVAGVQRMFMRMA